MKQLFIFFVCCVLLALNACQPEGETLSAVQTPQYDDTTVTSSETSRRLTGNAPVELVPRVSGTWNINMTGFRYVCQKRTMTQWTDATKYNKNGYCEYPIYIGTKTTQFGGNNLCGPASFLMALSLVPHDTKITIPTTDFDKAIRLCEFAKRYALFDANYKLGDFAYIDKLRNMANGTSTLKGEFTNWSNCAEKKWTATELSVQSPNSTGRGYIKDFIRTHIQNDHPVMVIITINTSYKDAYQTGYISTDSNKTGHLVVITGVTENDNTKIYKVRFKDPWPNNDQTYEVDYNLFLDSMVAFPDYYNALAFVGK